ncbi:hypothetical protein MKK88_01175 [Methylobacterium sp. E-005]|uniref:hypothetical protein n=1 Tax=Methylobacterium sp. E-005 TaxID=2836549 RepID=UPI001FB93292|nr:hypothetical protein [Methylobacterium sp. E-005]MCJ2084608.1 hypothetical protein [Methylobacterium sp. E-005]
MTTIAYRDGVMAADTGAKFGDAKHPWAQKLARGPDGTLYGASGTASEWETFLEWVRGGCKGDHPQPRDCNGDNSFVVLCVAPNGPVETITAFGRERFEPPYYALGYDACVAFGAMHAGACAEDAVEAAIVHGTGTFGAVTVIRHGL